MKKTSIQGFTLIEMLIVIAVISILAGIVLVGITGFQESARDTKRIGDLRSVQNSLELFYTRCGHYPTNGAGCGGADAQSVSWNDLANSFVGANIISGSTKMPSDPKGVSEYEYGYGDSGFSYVLKATLEGPNSAMDDSQEIDSSTGFSGNIDCVDANYGYCIGSSN